MSYDVIVIGGGTSGLMAAIAAGETGAKVLLIEKKDKLGRKISISGGGRCNVTNSRPVDEIIQHIPGNGRFLYGAFSVFNNEDIIAFFEKMGVELKEEDHGRMFPANDNAKSVVNALINRLKELNVEIKTNCPVKDIIYENQGVSGIQLKNGETLHTKACVIAVGGKSFPKTGSTGDGYPWAEKAGHTITELFPTEVPIVSNEPFIKNKTLQGLSLRNVALSVLNPKGKPIVTHEMDMLFTHFGISGPSALRCSQFAIKAMKKWHLQEVTMMIDCFPQKNEEQLFQEVFSLIKNEPKKKIKTILKGFLPERYLLFLLKESELNIDCPGAEVSGEKVRRFIKMCKQFKINVHGTLPIEQAFVTGGGVCIKEIEPKAMASKLMNGLYFCGEILDIHGYTGGYNITSALVTGRIAGMNAACYALNN